MKGREGFTLVELLVVIVIIGVLATIGLLQFGAAQRAADRRAVQANHRTIVGAIQMAYMAIGAGSDLPDDGQVAGYIDGVAALAELSADIDGTHDWDTETGVLVSSHDGGETEGTDQWTYNFLAEVEAGDGT